MCGRRRNDGAVVEDRGATTCDDQVASTGRDPHAPFRKPNELAPAAEGLHRLLRVVRSNPCHSPGSGTAGSRPSRGGPAATAGVQAGCLVTSIDDRTITTVSQFRSVLAQHRPGEEVMLGTYDPPTRQQMSVRVRLVTKAAMPEGD